MTTSEGSVPHVELYKASEVDVVKPSWLVDGLIQEGVTMLYAPPKTGKTFVALDIAMHTAASEPVWHGRRVQGGPVVYVSAEDGSGVRMRQQAWRRYHGLSDEALFGYDAPVYLSRPAHVDGFIAAVRKCAHSPALIVFDTLGRCIPGVDENSSGEMGLALDALERIRRETAARAILVVHHTRKDGKASRGSTAIQAAMQGVLKLTGSTAQGATLLVENQRNGAKGDTLALAFRGVGETLVVERGNEKPWKPQAQQQAQPRITRELVIEVLRAARKPLTEQEVASRVGFPQAVRAVKGHLSRLCKTGEASRNEVGYVWVANPGNKGTRAA